MRRHGGIAAGARVATKQHVLLSQATRLPFINNTMAKALDRTVLQSAVDAVPDEYLSIDVTETRRRRAAYVAFLWKRLKEPRPFLPTEA